MKKGLRRAAAAGVLALGVRAAIGAGAGTAVSEWLGGLAGDDRLIRASLSLELGTLPEESGEEEEIYVYPAFVPAEPTLTPEETPPATAPTKTESGAEILETTIEGGLKILNNTDTEVDVLSLTRSGAPQTLPKDSPQILIIHTHASEAYAPDSIDSYVASDTDRTEDTRYNVVRVGDELASELEERGLIVLHDREIYDYPSYTGSYSRSGAAVEKYLEEYPEIAVVIDLHRDALGDGDVVYKTVAEQNGVSSSQIMMLVGTGENGLYHPNWEDNLRLVLYLQQAADSKYKTLMRPVTLAKERYNQHLSTGMFILEVGSSGNTLQEALAAVRLYADAVAPALTELVEK